MTVRINKQKINLREKLAGVDEHISAEQSLAALNATTKDINVTNLYTNNEHIRNSGSFANNPYVPFGPHARMLDLANTNIDGVGIDANLKGFQGGFTDGRYGYFVPLSDNSGAYHGKIARVDLNDFSSVSVLDLEDPDGDGDKENAGLKGFRGGFTDGRYGYFVPYYNGLPHGKVARVDLSDFSSVSVLDLANTSIDGGAIDASLTGFIGGFTDGRYGYFVPNNNGSLHGKIARVDLSDFNNTSGNSVGILDLTQAPINGGPIDTSLKGFQGGFTDGRYGYFVPNNNGSLHGKIARVDLNDFSSVSILDLTGTDEDLKGFVGGFTDGRYGYFVPYNNGAYHGKIARVDLNDFSSVSVLDLEDPDGDGTKENAGLTGFRGGFTDGRYGYFVPSYNGSFHGKIARVDLNDFSSVSVLDLTGTDADLTGFIGGFTDGRYGYFVPYNNGAYHGKIARIQLFNGGNL